VSYGPKNEDFEKKQNTQKKGGTRDASYETMIRHLTLTAFASVSHHIKTFDLCYSVLEYLVFPCHSINFLERDKHKLMFPYFNTSVVLECRQTPKY